MTISVLQRHINVGICSSPWSCAISQAILETVPGVRSVDTGFYDVSMLINGRCVEFKTTNVMQDFIEAFDRNKSFCQPFSFEIPDELLPKDRSEMLAISTISTVQP